MAETDQWAGLVDPRSALAKRRAAAAALAGSSQATHDAGESGSTVETESYGRFSHSSRFSQGAVSPKPASQESHNKKIDFPSSYITTAYPISASAAGLLPPEPDTSDERASAKAANRLNHGLTRYDVGEITLAAPGESFRVANTVPSPIAHLSGPFAWRDGLARLDRWTPPCEGFRSGEWEAVHRAVSHFMDHCAAEAFARGWGAIDLFAVHGLAGAARVDSCGALMLPLLRNATALTADTITFGPLVYRRRAMPEAVLVWDFVGEAA